jgi:hypothetical protein
MLFIVVLLMICSLTACSAEDVGIDINPILQAAVTAVLIPIIGTVGAYLTSLIRAKIKNAKVASYLERANDAVMTSVAETMQTFVSTLRKEGKWTKDSANTALIMAKNRALNIMGTAARDALPDIVGDIDAWLTAKIEAATRAEKLAEPLLLEAVCINKAPTSENSTVQVSEPVCGDSVGGAGGYEK